MPKKMMNPPGAIQLFQYSCLSVPSILSSPWNYTQKKNYLSIQGFQGNNSNAVQTNFVHAILLNKSLDASIKEGTFRKLKKKNLYEDEINAELTYAHYVEHCKFLGKHYFFVSYKFRNMRNMKFDKEAFQLIFTGNKQFEEDTINIANTVFDYTGFNQYQIGINKIYEKESKTYTFGAALSLLQSPVNINLRARNSSIYTALDGEYLDVKYNMAVNQANQGPPEFFSFKGTGLGLDLNFGYFNNQKNAFRISATDLGFIKYTKDINNLKADSNLRFEGIQIDNILHYTQPSIFTNFEADSLFKILNVRATKKAYTNMLASTFQASYSQFILHKKGLLTLGVQYKMLPNYYPLIYAKFSYQLAHGFIPSASASFGGYSYYNIGAELSKTFRFGVVSVGSTNLLGVFLTNHFTSSSIYLRAAVIF
jgi:hypothetical protein